MISNVTNFWSRFDHHMDLAFTLSYIGKLKLSQHNDEEGLLYIEQSHKIVEGIDQLQSAILLQEITRVKNYQGNNKEAISPCEHSLEIYEKLGVEDSNHAMGMSYLALCYLTRQRFGDTISYLERARKMFEDGLGIDHSRAMCMLRQLGRTYLWTVNGIFIRSNPNIRIRCRIADSSNHMSP